MIIERHGEGAVMESDGKSLTCSIPTDRSVLSVLHNHFENGDCFFKDGWVYNDGKKIRKWFGSLHENGLDARIWEPKYDNIPLLENKRWKVIQYYQKWQRKYWDAAFAALKGAGQAHAHITHAFNGKYSPWWLYKCEDHGNGMGYGITFDWVDEPKNPLNLEIGNQYYYVSYYMSAWMNGRRQLFEAAFNRAMQHFLYKKDVILHGQTIKIQINGRLYWYISAVHHLGGIVWEPLAFPEKQVEEIAIT